VVKRESTRFNPDVVLLFSRVTKATDDAHTGEPNFEAVMSAEISGERKHLINNWLAEA